jgi:ABC-type lipopolysaccharide export system ATPase subunit
MIHKLEVDSIQLEFGQRRILADVYFKCETGSITGLLGRNGQGKTCLMNIVYGSMQVSSKSVRFDDVPIYEAFKRVDLLTYLPQFSFIPSGLTLKRIFLDFNISFSELKKWFPEFEGRSKTKINQLSGGQRRLIEVYVIIKSKAQFSMLDEPFSQIMPLHVETIKELLIIEKLNKGFLITDHMYRQIISICDSLYVLNDGKTHLTKSIEDIERLGYAKV